MVWYQCFPSWPNWYIRSRPYRVVSLIAECSKSSEEELQLPLKTAAPAHTVAPSNPLTRPIVQHTLLRVCDSTNCLSDNNCTLKVSQNGDFLLITAIFFSMCDTASICQCMCEWEGRSCMCVHVCVYVCEVTVA